MRLKSFPALFSLMLLCFASACSSGVTWKPADILFLHDGMAGKLHAAYITSSFFGANQKPYLGRLFSAQEYSPDHYVVILSYPAWQTTFHSDAAHTIGSQINLTGTDFTIVGVMPPSFASPSHAEILLPKDKIAN